MSGPTRPAREASTAGSPSEQVGSADGRSDRLGVRPSALLASAVGVLAATALGLAAGMGTATALAVCCSVGFAGGVALLADADPIRVAAGTALGTLSAAGLVGAAFLGPPLAVAALSLAAFGSASVPLGGVGGDRVVDAAGVLAYALVPAGVVVTLTLLARVAGVLFEGVLSTDGTAGSLTLFLVVAWATLFAALAALRGLPAVELAPRSKRRRVRSRVEAVDRGLRRALLWVGALLPVWFVLWALAEAEVGVVERAIAVPAAVAATPVVRAALLVVAVVAVVAAVGIRLLRTVGGTVVELTRRTTAMAVGGVLVVAVAPVSGRLYRTLLAVLDPATAGLLAEVAGAVGPLSTLLVTVGLATTAFLVALLVVPAAVGLGIAPERATAPALAAGGLVGAAALVPGDSPTAVVFGAIVAGMVVWDLGEFGRGLDEEVGDTRATGAELVHAAGSLGVGAVVTAGAVLAHDLVTGVRVGPATGLAALVFAFLGVVLLVAVLRG